jgi:hypothetical protein
MSGPVVRFAGTVSCTRHDGALRLTLSGTEAGPQSPPLTVGFAAPAPAGLPATLQDVVVACGAPGTYSIRSAAGTWTLAAPTVHVHRDVGAAFYRTVVPRPVPLRKRLFWRVVLGLAASRAGMVLLRRLRGSA